MNGQCWCRSNRSAALLKLKKAGKALEDAEACIRQRPDWDKGHYRRALALELTEKYSEARTCFMHALSIGAEAEPKRGDCSSNLSCLQACSRRWSYKGCCAAGEPCRCWHGA